jgi:hypothetical protein
MVRRRATMSEPSVLVAFVRESDGRHGVFDEGPILEANGDFLRELRDSAGGWDIGDHNMPALDGPGLWMLCGWIETGPGPDPDVEFVGSWERLSHWSMCRMRCGMGCEEGVMPR